MNRSEYYKQWRTKKLLEDPEGFRASEKKSRDKQKNKNPDAQREYFRTKAAERRAQKRDEILEYRRQWYAKNKGKINEQKKMRRRLETQEECDKRKKYDRKRREENPEKLKAWMKSWRDRNPNWAAEYYQKNKKKKDGQTLEWRRKNCESLQAKDRKRYAEDIAYCMKRRLSARLRVAFNRAMVKKTANTMDLVCCDSDFLLSHIESKFLPGMTWANRSEWHIDHIKPCASFDLTQKDQQKACFCWSNLQPLWGADNCSKGDKITDP